MNLKQWIVFAIIIPFCGSMTFSCKKVSGPESEPIHEDAYITAMSKHNGSDEAPLDYLLEYDTQGRVVKWGAQPKPAASLLGRQSGGIIQMSERPKLELLDRHWELSYSGDSIVTMCCDTYVESRGGNLFEYTYSLKNGKAVSMTGQMNHRNGANIMIWEENIIAKATYEGDHLTQWDFTATDKGSGKTTFRLHTGLTWDSTVCTCIRFVEHYPELGKTFWKYTLKHSDVANNLNLDWLGLSSVGLSADQSLQMAQVMGLVGVFTAFIPSDVTSDSDSDESAIDDDEFATTQAYTVSSVGNTISRMDEFGHGYRTEYKEEISKNF